MRLWWVYKRCCDACNMTTTDTVILALTTEADEDKARSLADLLLEKRVAACVSLTPVRSRYRWQGELQQASEVQLLIKSTAAQRDALHQLVMDRHSYDTPEWLSWPAQSSVAYGSWVAASCFNDT